jgi:hypothetical protein
MREGVSAIWARYRGAPRIQAIQSVVDVFGSWLRGNVRCSGSRPGILVSRDQFKLLMTYYDIVHNDINDIVIS